MPNISIAASGIYNAMSVLEKNCFLGVIENLSYNTLLHYQFIILRSHLQPLI